MTGAAKYLNPAMVDATIRIIKKLHGDNVIALASAVDSMCAAISARNVDYPEALKSLANEVSQALISSQTKNLQRPIRWSIGETPKCAVGRRGKKVHRWSTSKRNLKPAARRSVCWHTDQQSIRMPNRTFLLDLRP